MLHTILNMHRSNYYLEHKDEREQIARAGKELFDEYYDPERHGRIF